MGAVSFTADIWSNAALRPHLAITGHWIARDPITGHLLLKASLLAFHRIRGSHSGERIARITLFLLQRAGLVHKVSYHILIQISMFNH